MTVMVNLADHLPAKRHKFRVLPHVRADLMMFICKTCDAKLSMDRYTWNQMMLAGHKPDYSKLPVDWYECRPMYRKQD